MQCSQKENHYLMHPMQLPIEKFIASLENHYHMQSTTTLPHLCATPKPSHADLPMSHRIPKAGHLCRDKKAPPRWKRDMHGRDPIIELIGSPTPWSHHRPPITQSDPHQTKLNEFECQKDRKRNRCYNRRVKRKGCPN